MRVWLVTIGEPLPGDTKNKETRLHRAGILAHRLAAAGHETVWWTATFDHVNKRNRYSENTRLELAPNLEAYLLYGKPYNRNISIARIVNHSQVTNQFRELAAKEPKPDAILCSMPTPDLSRAAVEYAQQNNVPIALDIRDLWPDLFLEILPKPLQIFGRIPLWPLFRDVRIACQGATAILGNSPEFVKWGVRRGNRQASALDQWFPFGYEKVVLNSEQRQSAQNFWNNFGIDKRSNKFICCFFGAIGRQFDLEKVLEAAKKISQKNLEVQFVICGDGDNRANYEEMAGDLSNVIFPGWIDKVQISYLMECSSLGLAPYVETENFLLNLPNKVIEYWSAGLPVLCSIKGVIGDLLEDNRCGATYNSSDELVNQIELLYQQKGMRKEWGENSLDLFNKRFDADIVYTDMVKYLEKLSNKSQ